MFKPLLLTAVAAMVLTACQTTTTTTTTSTTTVTPSTPDPVVVHTKSALAVMQQNRETWQIANFGRYHYQLRRSCHCTLQSKEPVMLDVIRGEGVVQGYFVRTGRPLSSEFSYRKQTIDDLFNLITEAIDRKAYQVKVDYHPEHGYPTSIFIDYNQQQADEEVHMTISHLKAGPPK